MKGSLKYLSLITQIGLSIIVSVVIFMFLGIHLDRRLGTRGIFTVVLIIIGSASALWSTYKLIQETLRKDSEPR
ncbi:MAG: AtpZ/AtpI family protein [Firmicutes bacterium]|nr:AtpZ/AtpI family protein [Bacillota bacterium]